MDEQGEKQGQRRADGTFVKGHCPNPAGRGGKQDPPSFTGLYGDMRAVWNQRASEDKTAGQKHCRQWLKDKPKEFLAEMAKLEAAALVENAATPAAPVEEPDDQDRKLDDLIDEILKEIGA